MQLIGPYLDCDFCCEIFSVLLRVPFLFELDWNIKAERIIYLAKSDARCLVCVFYRDFCCGCVGGQKSLSRDLVVRDQTLSVFHRLFEFKYYYFANLLPLKEQIFVTTN